MGTKKLYKYLDVKGGLTMLYNKTLMFTHPLGLNDPFDCHPALIDCSNAPEEEERTKIWGPKLIEELETNHLEQKRDKAYLCCLSKVHNSIPMWAHYAKHCGICIGINMDKAEEYLDRMWGFIIGCQELEVQYIDIVNKPDFYRYSGCASTTGASVVKTSSTACRNSGSFAFFCFTSFNTRSMYLLIFRLSFCCFWD